MWPKDRARDLKCFFEIPSVFIDPGRVRLWSVGFKATIQASNTRQANHTRPSHDSRLAHWARCLDGYLPHFNEMPASHYAIGRVWRCGLAEEKSARPSYSPGVPTDLTTRRISSKQGKRTETWLPGFAGNASISNKSSSRDRSHRRTKVDLDATSHWLLRLSIFEANTYTMADIVYKDDSCCGNPK